MGSRRLALLGHGDRHLAELLGERRVLREELPQAHRGRQAGRPRSHDQDAHVDPLVLGRVRRDDVVGRDEGRRVVGREGAHRGLARRGEGRIDLTVPSGLAREHDPDDRPYRLMASRLPETSAASSVTIAFASPNTMSVFGS